MGIEPGDVLRVLHRVGNARSDLLLEQQVVAQNIGAKAAELSQLEREQERLTSEINAYWDLYLKALLAHNCGCDICVNKLGRKLDKEGVPWE